MKWAGFRTSKAFNRLGASRAFPAPVCLHRLVSGVFKGMIRRRLGIPDNEDGDRLDAILEMSSIFEMGELFWNDGVIKDFLTDVIR